jgi:hypothetical protein
MAKKTKHYRKDKLAISHVKKQRGIDRQAFIDTNGDMKQWIPLLKIAADKKKSKNKRACRGKHSG